MEWLDDAMTAFLAQLLAMPTVVFTGFLVVAILYWVFVIFGALDIDMLDVDVDGAFEGGAESSAETAEGLTDGMSVLSFMSWVGMRNAPFTVVFSLIALFSWAFSMLGNRYLAPALGGGLIAALVVAVVAVVASLPLTSAVSIPLGPLFRVKAAEGRRDLVGCTCVIETGSVDERFGVATVQDGARWHRIEVRATAPNPLVRGAEALIVDYDGNEETFRVERIGSAK